MSGSVARARRKPRGRRRIDVGEGRLVLGLELGAHRFKAGLVVGGAVEGAPHLGEQVVGVLVEQRAVQLELAREVLVEHGLADAGALGDVVHRRRVVAVGDEQLVGCTEQLLAPGGPGQPGPPCGAPVLGRGHGPDPIEQTRLSGARPRRAPRRRPAPATAAAPAPHPRRPEFPFGRVNEASPRMPR